MLWTCSHKAGDAKGRGAIRVDAGVRGGLVHFATSPAMRSSKRLFRYPETRPLVG